MPWYLIAAMLAPSLIVAVGLTYVSLRLAYRIGSLETFQSDMMEGAIRRDAAAAQVGRILGLRSAKATASKFLDRELREAAYCRQESGDKEAAVHDHASRVLSEVCDRLQEDLYLAGDKEECGQSCNANAAVNTDKNLINLCDYCTDERKKPRPKR